MPRGRAYRFIETPIGPNPTTRDFQRRVRSHAASASRSDRTTRRQTRRRGQNEGEGIIVFDANPVEPSEAGPSDPPPPTAASSSNELAIVPRPSPTAQDQQLQPNPYRLRTDYLSGDTFSPLMQLPTYHRPYLPGIINHYIYNLTIPIPELDGNSPIPLFRAVWLPIVFHDPLVFQVVVLFAATHYATIADLSQFDNLYPELLSLKQSALLALIQRVQGEQNTSSTSTNLSRDSRNMLIAAAAKMASYEAIFGTSEAFHLHMSTVTRLLRLEGGLASLGMNGFLARLLSFIDTNSSFLLGTNLYLVEFGLSNRMPHHQPFHPRRFNQVAVQAQRQMEASNVLDLEHFIGLMSIRDEENQATLPTACEPGRRQAVVDVAYDTHDGSRLQIAGPKD